MEREPCAGGETFTSLSAPESPGFLFLSLLFLHPPVAPFPGTGLAQLLMPRAGKTKPYEKAAANFRKGKHLFGWNWL